jgi:hypothetical protein
MHTEPADDIDMALPQAWRNVWSGTGEALGGGAVVQAYAKHYGWHDCIVLLVVMDNIAAICYWNRQGHSSGEELNEVMRPPLEFFRLRAIMVIATYCPGAEMVADEPSRRAATVLEYYLRRSIFETLELILLGARGAVKFDLCASMANVQTKRYASLTPDPHAEWVDCTKHPWGQERNRYYAFPPPLLTRSLIEKAAAEEQALLLVSPACSMDETTPPAHHRDTDRGAAGDPMDGAGGTKPTRGQVPGAEGAIGRELVPMAPGWVSNIRQQVRVRGTAPEAAEAYALRDWLESQPILSKYTADGSATAKAWEWIQYAHRTMQS